MNYMEDIPCKVIKSAIDGLDLDKNSIYNAVIEISNGDNIKYELHPNGQYLTPVKALNPIFRYPFSYGFIPRTLEEDGDGLDVIVITPEPIARLSVVEVRILGYVPTIDDGVSDVKLIAVPAYSSLKKVSMDKVMAFLKNYKYPECGRTMVGEYCTNISEAEAIIKCAHERFMNKVSGSHNHSVDLTANSTCKVLADLEAVPCSAEPDNCAVGTDSAVVVETAVVIGEPETQVKEDNEKEQSMWLC